MLGTGLTFSVAKLESFGAFGAVSDVVWFAGGTVDRALVAAVVGTPVVGVRVLNVEAVLALDTLSAVGAFYTVCSAFFALVAGDRGVVYRSESGDTHRAVPAIGAVETVRNI